MTDSKHIVFSPEELNKMNEMKELLIEAFEGSSSFYEIYKKRGWLDRLFTDKILLMDKDAIYSTQQTADLCEVPEYSIRNKRKEFLEYVDPLVLEAGSKPSYKFNYISVFKMKMIDGLTGEGGDYTLSQLKQLLYNTHIFNQQDKNTAAPRNNDSLLEMFHKIDELVNEKISDVKSELTGYVNKKLEDLALPSIRALQDANQSSAKLHQKLKSISDEITSSTTSIEDKERILSKLSDLRIDFPEQSAIIDLYQKTLNDTVALAKEQRKEKELQLVKTKAIGLFRSSIDSNKTLEDRDSSIKQLMDLLDTNPNLNFELNSFVQQALSSLREAQQEQREKEILIIKSKALELYELVVDEKNNKQERDNYMKQLQDLANNNPDLSFDIRHYVVSAYTANKKRTKFLGIF